MGIGNQRRHRAGLKAGTGAVLYRRLQEGLVSAWINRLEQLGELE